MSAPRRRTDALGLGLSVLALGLLCGGLLWWTGGDRPVLCELADEPAAVAAQAQAKPPSC